MTSGRLILVAKLKGGSGATTTCRELTAAAMHDGRTVALIDLDGQGGLSRWWNRRTAPVADGEVQRNAPELLQLTAAQIPGAANGLRQRYDLVVIDSPPSVHETIRADRPPAAWCRGSWLRAHAGACRSRIKGRCRGAPAARRTGAGPGAHHVPQRLQPPAGLWRHWFRGRRGGPARNQRTLCAGGRASRYHVIT
jgi:hypothetical protein